MPAIRFLRGSKDKGEEQVTTIGQTQQKQWVAEAPETTAPSGRHDLFDVYGAWLGNPYERYGPLELAGGISMKRKVAMMKNPILAMCIGYAGAMMINAKRVIVCKDAAKQRFFEAMFRMWEKEFVLSANVGIALGAIGLEKKWRFMKPDRVNMEGPDPWTGRATPYIVKGFNILHPLLSSPRFDTRGRVFQGIETEDGSLDVFYSLWLTFRKELAFGAYEGAGRLEHCYKDWWMSQYGEDNYLIAMQKEADRVVKVGYPPGVTNGVQNQAIAVNVGDAVRSGATVAMPTSVYELISAADGSTAMTNVSRWTMDFLEGSGSFQRFHEIDDQHSKKMCLGYFIPPQTIIDVKQSALGGPTTADVLGDISIELLLQDAADMDRHLNQYVFPAVSKANFPGDSPEVRVETIGLDPDNVTQLGEIVKDMMSVSPDSKFFDMREAMKRIGLPLRSEEDVEKAEREDAEKAQAAQVAQAALPTKEQGSPEAGGPAEPAVPGKGADGIIEGFVATADGNMSRIHGEALSPWQADRQLIINPEDIAAALVDWELKAPEAARGLLVAFGGRDGD